MKIRTIAQADLAKVRELDGAAWEGISPPLKNQTRRYRTLANLVSNWSEDPSGCFAAEENGDLVGYVFSHIWGSLGWIGTFGVSPENRGRGIGKKLLVRSIKHLESNGCTTIGLETRPESSYNLGLYFRHGFRPTYLTLETERKITNHPAKGEFVEWSKLERDDRVILANKFRTMCHLVRPGLDYVKMGISRVMNNEGEMLAFGDKKHPRGFAVVRFAPKFTGENHTKAVVEAMVVNPGSEKKFVQMIEILDVLARKWNRRNLVLPVNSGDWDVLKRLVRSGFLMRRSMLRMIYKERVHERRGVDLSLWAM